jgi:hypothetical protein
MAILDRARPDRGARRRLPPKAVKALLGCGIAYPVVYAVTNDVIAASRYDSYSRLNQAVSELSATGAPTRRFLTASLPALTALQLGYGVAVWKSADGRRAVRASGAVLLASGVTAPAWLPFPMSPRGDIAAGKATGSDTGHLVLTALTVTEILALLGVGSSAFGPRFRAYSLLSAATVLVSGALTSALAPKLTGGKPTPGMGLYERVSIGTWLLWMAVFAVILLRERHPLPTATAG